MAQLLYERDSTARHLTACRRHMRLCRRHNQNALADTIKPMYDNLIRYRDDRKELVIAKEDANDDMLMADDDLDNGVRNLFEALKTFDRNNPTAPVLHRVFTTQTVGEIVRLPYHLEPDVVQQLCLRLEALGEDHPMYAHSAPLKALVTASHASINTYQETVRQVKMAEAEEQIAQMNLRKQYELNYLKARADTSKTFAERLFPVIAGRSVHLVAETEETPIQTT